MSRAFLHRKSLLTGGLLTLILLSVSLGISLGVSLVADAFLSNHALSDYALPVVLPLLAGAVILVQLEAYHRSLDVIYQQDEKFEAILQRQQQMQMQQTDDYAQIESLFSIFALLQLRHPLPPMREWAISPDFAKHLMALIYEHRPQLILEISSGVSTVLMGYCLQAIGNGVVISLEHEARYAKISRSAIQHHGLQETAQVIDAPLQPIQIDEQTWQWYDLTAVKLPRKIDLLVIDGPPGDLQPLSRYPALPLLLDCLSDDCVVILDDGKRADETQIVQHWQQEFGFEIEAMPVEKGAFILRRKAYQVNQLSVDQLLSHSVLAHE